MTPTPYHKEALEFEDVLKPDENGYVYVTKETLVKTVKDLLSQAESHAYRRAVEDCCKIMTTHGRFDERDCDILKHYALSPEQGESTDLKESHSRLLERFKDDFLGIVVRNSRGFEERDGERLWHVNMEFVEKDLSDLLTPPDTK